MNALDIDTFDLGQGETFVSGVVTRLISKGKSSKSKSSKGSNIDITTPAGKTIALTITNLTILEKDGVPVPYLSVGDVVRPTSRYNTQTGEILKLSVKTPELQGTVRGKYSAPSGRRYITISTDQLNVVTVLVLSDAELIKAG